MCNLSDLIVYNRVVMDVVNSYTKLSKSLIKGTWQKGDAVFDEVVVAFDFVQAQAQREM